MAAEIRLNMPPGIFDEQDNPSRSISANERVVELLNQAALFQKDVDRIKNLKIVQELIVQKEPALLDSFLDEMLAFQNDRSQDVKKFVVGFIEEACKHDPELLPKVMPNLAAFLQDDNVSVAKRLILAMMQLYKLALQWVAAAKSVSDQMERAWAHVGAIKTAIVATLESENDGVRTHAIKFVESIAIVLTERTADSEVPKRCEGDVSLDQIPPNHPLLKVKKLEAEGRSAVESLLKFMASAHISSVNLMTCMGSLSNFAKQRPAYLPRAVQGYEALHVNLPPTLAKSQVSSVRKNLKMQMLSLLKHPAALDLHPQITTLLQDLGATQAEVMKNMPKEDAGMRKRKAADQRAEAKKARVEHTTSIIPMDKEDDDEDELEEPEPAPVAVAPAAPLDLQQKAIDITAQDLMPRLTAQNVADLVLLSMVMLPESMPASFQSTYTPIAAAGTAAQIRHLSRLLATQLTLNQLGKGFTDTEDERQAAARTQNLEAAEDEEEASTSAQEQPVGPQPIMVLGAVPVQEEPAPAPVLPPPQPVPPPSVMQVPPPQQTSRKGIKVFKLSSVTAPMDRDSVQTMAVSAFSRVLAAEKDAIHGDASSARNKMLVAVVTQYGGKLKDVMIQWIFADLRNRTDVALSWVYQEYANYQGYISLNPDDAKTDITSYDEVLTRLLAGLLERTDQREGLFSRLLLEAPLITQSALAVLRRYCQEESRIFFGMTTLQELILRRPAMKLDFLDVLLDFTSHDKVEVRQNAIRVAKRLHQMADFTVTIEKSALYYLKYLLNSRPPAELFSHNRGTHVPEGATWTEEYIKLCLYLYLALLPVNHGLIHELAHVYTGTTADIKRTVLRVLEAPVKGMGMHSPELLSLVETCPKGAETLVTRIIHILTDKTQPSPQLVERVRDLYQKRVSDVRFLIPVLNGLTMQEVVVALPALIRLNPVVVREVFNRLLMPAGPESPSSSPLSPAELLIALHNIDSAKCEMKTIIKATTLCFNERSSYTSEVLAVVMQSLMEQNPLPTLFMRTVIQALAMYPELIGHVMNILQRLIGKQVWKQKKVWEGFVKCCQRTQPQSYPVLLQLPAPQLKATFDICPDVRAPLLAHVIAFTPHQRAHIPKTIVNVLEADPAEELRAAAQATRARQDEDERLAQQERLYQAKLDEERQRQLQMQSDSTPPPAKECGDGDENPADLEKKVHPMDVLLGRHSLREMGNKDDDTRGKRARDLSSPRRDSPPRRHEDSPPRRHDDSPRRDSPSRHHDDSPPRRRSGRSKT